MAKSKKRVRKQAGPKSGSKKKARSDRKHHSSSRESASVDEPTSALEGGGVMQRMRSGFKRAAGVGDEPQQKESTLSKVLWGLLMAGAVAYLVYKYTQ